MNRSESKYFQTAERMDEALIELLQQKELPYITVREICVKAEVNRSTFYLHYATVVDLLNECVEYMNRRFFSYFTEESKAIVQSIAEEPLDRLMLVRKEYLVPFLTFIRDNRTLYAATVDHPEVMQSMQRYEMLWKCIINPVMDRFHLPEEKRGFYNAFFMNGILAVIMEWVKKGCRESPGEVSEIIEAIFQPFSPKAE